MEDIRISTEFDQEPVYYCSSCLSLAVREMSGGDFCDKCGCVDIQSAQIEEWEELYKKMYGHKYI